MDGEMTEMPHKSVLRGPGVRERTLVIAMALAAAFVSLGAASPALASKIKEEFVPFADCPVEAAADCLVANTTGGEFVLDHKTVPITKTVTIQGGIATALPLTAQPLVGAVGGETLSKTPLTVPGGLVGIEGLGGEVTATAEIAGPPSSVIVNRIGLALGNEPAVTLPLKIHLENPTLGNECYIGTDAEPIVLHLTTGTTSPPFPGKPISGKFGTFENAGKGKIRRYIGNSLVDNDFAVPGATGCGGVLSFLIDPGVDLIVGIPAPAGFNTAIMNGPLEETNAEFAAKYKPKPKKTKK